MFYFGVDDYPEQWNERCSFDVLSSDGMEIVLGIPFTTVGLWLFAPI
jgi:hypothetical protein